MTGVRQLSLSEMRQYCDKSIADMLYDAKERGVFLHPGDEPTWIEASISDDQPLAIECECESGDVVVQVSVDGHPRWRQHLRSGSRKTFYCRSRGDVRVSVDKNGCMEGDHVYVRMVAGAWTYRCL